MSLLDLKVANHETACCVSNGPLRQAISPQMEGTDHAPQARKRERWSRRDEPKAKKDTSEVEFTKHEQYISRLEEEQKITRPYVPHPEKPLQWYRVKLGYAPDALYRPLPRGAQLTN